MESNKESRKTEDSSNTSMVQLKPADGILRLVPGTEGSNTSMVQLKLKEQNHLGLILSRSNTSMVQLKLGVAVA